VYREARVSVQCLSRTYLQRGEVCSTCRARLVSRACQLPTESGWTPQSRKRAIRLSTLALSAAGALAVETVAVEQSAAPHVCRHAYLRWHPDTPHELTAMRTVLLLGA
jgi:hypothetical protein